MNPDDVFLRKKDPPARSEKPIELVTEPKQDPVSRLLIGESIVPSWKVGKNGKLTPYARIGQFRNKPTVEVGIKIEF